MTVLTINFNTPELLEACLRSVRKQMGDGQRIVVVENSDRRPWTCDMEGVEVIDNSRGQLVDFDRRLAEWPGKWQNGMCNNWASARHTLTVDAMTDVLADGFVLIDSDVLLRRDLSVLADRDMACVSDIQTQIPRKGCVQRFCPYCQWVNVPMLREHGIRYFNGHYMWLLTRKFPNCWYDTGAWLLKAVRDKGLPYREIKYDDYVLHFDHGSHYRTAGGHESWLKEHLDLWTING
jgi:hypothetical protein